MRRRQQSPLFPLFQVHMNRWIPNTLQILCFSETIHHLYSYICRWNWIIVRGVSCLLEGASVQTPPHTSIKTSRQVTVIGKYPSVCRLFSELSVRRTPQKYYRLDIPASLWHLHLSIFVAHQSDPERSMCLCSRWQYTEIDGYHSCGRNTGW